MSEPTEPPRGRDEIVAAALDAAEQLFADRGPDHVSMRTIAEEAGITYSLLNRHLGTKQHLVDALLARVESRWRARVGGADLTESLGLLLGDDPDTGAYLRLLAWSLLAGEGDLAAHDRHSAISDLVPLARETGADDAATLVAVALSLVFGWRFFNPYITRALDLDDDTQRVHASIATLTSRLATGALADER